MADVGMRGWILEWKSKNLDMCGGDIVVGKEKGLVLSPHPLRTPTQYHRGLFCGMPWSLVLRTMWCTS